jgi:hypothetical protein
MNTKTLVRGVLPAAGAAAVVGRRFMRDDGAIRTTDRWHAVTVYRSPDQIMPEGRLPDPLAALGDKVDVQVRPAPGDKGTEIAARVRGQVPAGIAELAARAAGTDPRQPVRKALRETKMLLETGEILERDRPSTTRRTITNLPLELVLRRAGEEGRL